MFLFLFPQIFGLFVRENFLQLTFGDWEVKELKEGFRGLDKRRKRIYFVGIQRWKLCCEIVYIGFIYLFWTCAKKVIPKLYGIHKDLKFFQWYLHFLDLEYNHFPKKKKKKKTYIEFYSKLITGWKREGKHKGPDTSFYGERELTQNFEPKKLKSFIIINQFVSSRFLFF